MSPDEIRSIGQGPAVAMICGTFGWIAGAWLKTKMLRWVPERVGIKGRDQLLREHNGKIRTAHALSVGGIGVGLLCYKTGWLDRYDWRGMGVGLGLTAMLPLSYAVAVNARLGRDALKEVLITMSIAEKTPVRLYFGLMAACFAAGVFSGVSLLLQHFIL